MMMRAFPRRPVLLGAALALAACAPAGRPELRSFAADTRTPSRRLADSTEHLVTFAAIASDSAVIIVTLTPADSALDLVRARVRSARAGAEGASTRLAEAVIQGDRLRHDVVAETRGSRQADDYEHFWLLGRDKLLLARAYSDLALAAADSALDCPEAGCTRSRTKMLHSQLTAASGAAREAESLVRVAMRYVD